MRGVGHREQLVEVEIPARHKEFVLILCVLLSLVISSSQGKKKDREDSVE